MPAVLKWGLVLVGGLSVLVIAYLLYANLVINPRVVAQLRTSPEGERAGIVLLLRLPDDREIPVNYLREGKTVYVGADGRWWRTIGEGAKVSMLVRGNTLQGQASVVLDNPQMTRDVFSRLRPKAPAWLPDWLNGKLIVITLEQ